MFTSNYIFVLLQGPC